MITAIGFGSPNKSVIAGMRGASALSQNCLQEFGFSIEKGKRFELILN